MQSIKSVSDRVHKAIRHINIYEIHFEDGDSSRKWTEIRKNNFHIYLLYFTNYPSFNPLIIRIETAMPTEAWVPISLPPGGP
jgi:hypothetical protein